MDYAQTHQITFLTVGQSYGLLKPHKNNFSLVVYFTAYQKRIKRPSYPFVNFMNYAKLIKR